jgi:hypothetical protein
LGVLEISKLETKVKLKYRDICFAHATLSLGVVLTHDLIAVLHPLATTQSKHLRAACAVPWAACKHIGRVIRIQNVDAVSSVILQPSIRRENLDSVVYA